MLAVLRGDAILTAKVVQATAYFSGSNQPNLIK